MKKGAGICFQLVTVYIQHEKYASVSIPRGFKERPIKRQRKKSGWLDVFKKKKRNLDFYFKIKQRKQTEAYSRKSVYRMK